jgi:ADP-heptose:LPS heptosyltransferase
MMRLETAQVQETGIVSDWPLSIYTGVLGQIGDIVMFTATVRRLKELFPRGTITFAVSARYREAGELVAGLPYVDRLFVTECYFERMTDRAFVPWNLGWPVDFRGDDEIRVERQHDLVLCTRPRHRRERWWEHNHQVAELAYMVGVPGPIDLQTEICIPPDVTAPAETVGKVILHNDPTIDERKAWPWENVVDLVRCLGCGSVVLLGNPGPAIPGALDYRGRTTLAQAAAILAESTCYVGIDSGLMWIAGSLQAPTVGLYGTSYIPAYEKVQPVNPNAQYLQAEGSVSEISARAVLEATERIRETGRVVGVER